MTVNEPDWVKNEDFALTNAQFKPRRVVTKMNVQFSVTFHDTK